MAGCCSEKLTVEKFMFCIPLRTGTTIISWLILLYSTCFYVLLHSYVTSSRTIPKPSDEFAILILISYIVISGALGHSAGTLMYMPSPYETNFKSRFCCFAVNRAKVIRNFARYNMILAVYIVVVYISLCIGLSESKFQEFNLNYYKLFQLAFLVIFQSGLHIHFAAVLFSHYKSII